MNLYNTKSQSSTDSSKRLKRKNFFVQAHHVYNIIMHNLIDVFY